MAKNILIIAAHLDDEVLGCGGTIARHLENKDNLCVCFIAHRVYDHKFNGKKYEIEKRHAHKAKKMLGYKEAVFFNLKDERLDASVQDIIILLEKYVNKVKPETAYIPFVGDNNQDHRAVYDAARVVFRPIAAPFVENLFMYEVPSSTEQSPPLRDGSFLPNYHVDITKTICKKIETFKCYKSERRAYPHPRSGKAIKILAQKRGIEIGFEYAEAFMVLRKKWK